MDPDAPSRSLHFGDAAESLWESEEQPDSPATIAGLVLLYTSAGSHGRELAPKYLTALADVTRRMRLAGAKDGHDAEGFAMLSTKVQKATMYAAWAAYNILT